MTLHRDGGGAIRDELSASDIAWRRPYSPPYVDAPPQPAGCKRSRVALCSFPCASRHGRQRPSLAQTEAARAGRVARPAGGALTARAPDFDPHETSPERICGPRRGVSPQDANALTGGTARQRALCNRRTAEKRGRRRVWHPGFGPKSAIQPRRMIRLASEESGQMTLTPPRSLPPITIGRPANSRSRPGFVADTRRSPSSWI